jgi:hypothetical protein
MVLLQLRSHEVEGMRELADLATGMNRDALVQVALGDPLSRIGQSPQGGGKSSREGDAGYADEDTRREDEGQVEGHDGSNQVLACLQRARYLGLASIGEVFGTVIGLVV